MKKFIPIIFLLSFLSGHAQTLSSITPNSALQGQTLTVSITGQNTNFQQGTNAIYLAQGSASISPVSTSFISSTQISATFNFSVNHPVGKYALKLSNFYNSSVISLDSAFTLSANPNTPSISSASPVIGKQGDTVSMIINGLNTHFLTDPHNGIMLSNGFKYLEPVNTSALTNTSIQAKFFISYGLLPGTYNICVNNSVDGNICLNNAFQVQAGSHPPSFTVTPNTGTQGQILNVTISGQNTHFLPATGGLNGVRLIGQGDQISPTSLTYVNDSLLQATFQLTYAHHPGLHDVYIDNYYPYPLDPFRLANGFTVNLNAQQWPYLLSLSPDTARQGDTVNITVKGVHTHFLTASNVKIGGIIPLSVNVMNDSLLQARFVFTYSHYPGSYTLQVTNAIDGNLAKAFVLKTGLHAPALKSISPDYAQQGQTLTVSISGQNTSFIQASGSLALYPHGMGYNVNASSVTVINDTLIQAVFSFPANQAPGSYGLQVFNYMSNQFLVLNHCFTVFASGANIVSLTPASALRGDTVDISLHAIHAHFLSGTNTVSLHNFYGDSIMGTHVNVVNDSLLSARFIFSDSSLSGLYWAVVQNTTDGRVKSDTLFTLNNKPGLPSIINVSTQWALYSTPYSTTIKASDVHFQQGVDSVMLVCGTLRLMPASLNVLNDSMMMATFLIPSSNAFPTSYYSSIQYLDVVIWGSYPLAAQRAIMVTWPVQVKENDQTERVVIYPNPTNRDIYVENNSDKALQTLEIIDMEGRLVLRQNATGRLSHLDISTFGAGMYYLRLIGEHAVELKKIIKE